MMRISKIKQTKRIFVELTIPVGILCIADIANDRTVHNLKERIYLTLHYPIHQQRLHYRGAILSDEKKFKEYPGITERSRLRLSLIKEEDELIPGADGGLVLGTKMRPYKHNPYYMPRTNPTKYVDLKPIHTIVYVPLCNPMNLYAPDVIELIQKFLKNSKAGKQPRQPRRKR